MNLRDIISELAKTDDVPYCAICTVTSVDKSTNLCEVEPLDDTAPLIEVRLQALKGKGVVYYPVVGSTVVVSFLSKDDAYISLVSEVDVIDIQSQNESLKAILADMLAAIKVITVTTPSGPSGMPINAPQFTAIENRLNNLFK